jgi:hypothetical protein
LLGTTPFVLIVCGHNYLRFGDILQHGYDDAVLRRYGLSRLFDSSPLPTIAAMLVSPGKGLLWYCPLLFIALLGAQRFYRAHTFLSVLCILTVLGNFIFHSFFTIWAGDLAWGPRFQISVVPLMLLPLVEVVQTPPISRAVRRFCQTVVLVSLLIQSTSVAYNFNLEFWQNTQHGPVPDSYTWKTSESHLLLRFQNVFLHLSGQKNIEVEAVEEENHFIDRVNRSAKQLEIAHSVNFFPFKAAAIIGNKGGIARMLLLVWVVLALASACAWGLLYRQLRGKI